MIQRKQLLVIASFIRFQSDQSELMSLSQLCFSCVVVFLLYRRCLELTELFETLKGQSVDTYS